MCSLIPAFYLMVVLPFSTKRAASSLMLVSDWPLQLLPQPPAAVQHGFRLCSVRPSAFILPPGLAAALCLPVVQLLSECLLLASFSTVPPGGWGRENTISALGPWQSTKESLGGLAITLHTSRGSKEILGRLLDPQTCVHATNVLRCVTGAKTFTVLTWHCHFIFHNVCWLKIFHFFTPAVYKYSEF